VVYLLAIVFLRSDSSKLSGLMHLPTSIGFLIAHSGWSWRLLAASGVVQVDGKTDVKTNNVLRWHRGTVRTGDVSPFAIISQIVPQMARMSPL